jgi:hypothetical protein
VHSTDADHAPAVSASGVRSIWIGAKSNGKIARFEPLAINGFDVILGATYHEPSDVLPMGIPNLGRLT